MRHYFIILVLVIPLITFSMTNKSEPASNYFQFDQLYQSNDSISETELIERAVEHFYIKGLQQRDFDLIR